MNQSSETPNPGPLPDDKRTAKGPDPRANPADALAPPGPSPDLNPANETDLWRGRTSWKHYMGRLAGWGVLAIAAAVGTYLLVRDWERLNPSGGVLLFIAVVAIAGLIIGWSAIVVILGNRYRLTSQRLFIERGILHVTVDQLELIRVDDVRIHKTLADRMFGLGTIEIISTDASDRNIMILGVADSDTVAEHVRRRMRTMRKSSLYVENL
jgi:membrane protein YdbS with pleckstrin-like domain